LKKKNQELEKFKFVLDYKIKEVSERGGGGGLMKTSIRASERSELVTTSVRVQTRNICEPLLTNPFAPSSLGAAEKAD